MTVLLINKLSSQTPKIMRMCNQNRMQLGELKHKYDYNLYKLLTLFLIKSMTVECCL